MDVIYIDSLGNTTTMFFLYVPVFNILRGWIGGPMAFLFSKRLKTEYEF
jgi:hypothetical protein